MERQAVPDTVYRLLRRVPTALVEAARRHAETGAEPVGARDAAVVVLLRDRPGSIEAYLLRRPQSMSFAPGAYVFPGGAVEPGDRTGHPSAAAHAAVRETFEESGVKLEVESLRPWARWVTPEFERKRFDTYFFVAALPSGQSPSPDPREADGGAWMQPGRCLEAYAREELWMLPPTVMTLIELAGFDTVHEVLDAAPARDLSPRMPTVMFQGGEGLWVLPDDEEYDR